VVRQSKRDARLRSMIPKHAYIGAPSELVRSYGLKM
jgi:hypothetical protein